MCFADGLLLSLDRTLPTLTFTPLRLDEFLAMFGDLLDRRTLVTFAGVREMTGLGFGNKLNTADRNFFIVDDGAEGALCDCERGMILGYHQPHKKTARITQMRREGCRVDDVVVVDARV